VANELDSWARRAALLPAALVDATLPATRASAEVLEAAVRVNLMAATGGDLRLSRVRSGRGARIALSLKAEGAGRSARTVVVPTGPIMLVETDTKRHGQPFSYTYNRRVKKRGQRPIYVPGRGVFARVNHPGTKGKRPVGKAFASTRDAAGRAGVAVFATAAQRHLSGG